MDADIPTHNPPIVGQTASIHRADRLSSGLKEAESLTALSSAVGGSKTNAPGDPQFRGRSNPALAIIASIIVGAAVVLAGPFQYLCGATIRVSSHDLDKNMPLLRQQLLDYSWTKLSPSLRGNGAPNNWFVDVPSSALLRLNLATSNQSTGVALVREIAGSFVESVDRQLAEMRSSKSDGELALTESSVALGRQLQEAEELLREAAASKPTDDPRSRQQALLENFRSIRTGYAKAMTSLEDASSQMQALRQQGEPIHGVITAETRDQAYHANLALQQDLRELRVTMTELKLAMLKTWQDSSALLDRLGETSHVFVSPSSNPSPPSSLTNSSESLQSIQLNAKAYDEALADFALAWTKEFTTLQQSQIDSLSPSILGAHKRAQTLLNRFLFEGGKMLSAVRKSVQKITDSSPDQAKFHVWQSNLIRRFEELQSQHHRFEFAAGRIQPQNSYKLNSALQGTIGLQRRSQRQIQTIEKELEAIALRGASDQYTHDLLAAQTTIETIRASADAAIKRLVEIQDELNENIELTESALRIDIQQEFASREIQSTKAGLERTESHLHGLEQKRIAAIGDIEMTLVESKVIDGPIDLKKRLQTGGVGSLLTLLTVGLGQWWFGRRP